MDRIALVARLCRYVTEKQASTALVRRMAQGLLSPKTIQRAASAMPAGKFRTVRNLGRGQFNLADEVVGNVGGHAGRMVRKLPTQRINMPQEYGVLQNTVNRLNNQYGRQWFGLKKTQPIAPYVAAGPQGAFQQFADARVRPSKALQQQLGDLHSGNVGPSGQIFDFSVPGQPFSGPLPKLPGQQRMDPWIDEASTVTTHGRYGERFRADMLGNVDHARSLPDAHRQALQQYLPRSNNMIRRYWSLPPEQQAAYLQQLQQAMPARRQQLMQMQQHAVQQSPYAQTMVQSTPGMDSTTLQAGGAPQQGMSWRNLYEMLVSSPIPEERLAQRVLQGAGAGGAAYGGYRMYGQQ